MKIVNALLLSLVAISLFGCATATINKESKFTEQEEIQIGQEVASGILGASPLYPNQNVQRYVNQVGRWLASQTHRPDLPWTFGVLNDDGINAFAAPGGQIFITWGLMQRLSSETELAGVLAHEIGHVLARHQVVNLEQMQNAAAAGQALLNVADIVGKSKGGNTGRDVAVATSILGSAPVKDVSKRMFGSSLSKEAEYEADRLAITVMGRSGYDPAGLASVMQVFHSLSAGDRSGAAELLFATHPSPADRLAEMEKVINALSATLPKNGEIGRDRYFAQTGISVQSTSVAQQAPIATPAQTSTPAPAVTTKAPVKKPAVKSNKPKI
jgi:beta-barrel assembly-enhancing protease